MCIFMLVMMILLAGGDGLAGKSDYLGHLGGAIYGLLFGMAFYPRPRDESGKKSRLIGFAMFTSMCILMIALLFGLHA